MSSNLAFGKTNVNSLGRIYINNGLLFNADMDIDDIRRANIRALEMEAGSATAAAERVGMTGVQYTNLKKGARDPRSGKQRGMRKETARRFEDAFGKWHGWLDIDHTLLARAEQPGAIYPVRPHHARPLVQQVCDVAETIDDAGLRDLLGIARCLAGSHPLAKAKRA